ncbi:restriction endonuclease [Streptomyces sp. NPDC059753]|uniref:restriction endonuclease n=1 Tax=Streptomyces sp. NPDC059753 TaxID=3346933 RepID=UPI003647C89B
MLVATELSPPSSNRTARPASSLTVSSHAPDSSSTLLVQRRVIQCKHRKKGLDGSAVGALELQTLNGTGRPVHGGDVVVMVTNGKISRPARVFAR